MVFWIVFSVIHILATLLLSTQLYYMGRWRLGEVPALVGRPVCCASDALAHAANDLSASADSGVLRRIGNVIYTDCIRQCSGPMYIVSHDRCNVQGIKKIVENGKI